MIHAHQFLFNPENESKNYNEVQRALYDAGGTVLGSGTLGTVFHHPSWNYVLKIFEFKDFNYLRFLRYAEKNPMSIFPKTFGLPKKIVPNFRRYPELEEIYYVRLEKLHHIRTHATEFYNAISGSGYLHKIQEIFQHIQTHGIHPLSHDDIKNISREFRNYYNTFETIWNKVNVFKEIIEFLFFNAAQNPLFEAARCDLHYDNIMARSNGEIVLSDPFYHEFSQIPKHIMSHIENKKCLIEKVYEGKWTAQLQPFQTLKDAIKVIK